MKVLVFLFSVVFISTCFFGCSSIPIGGYKSVNADGDTLLYYLAQKDYESQKLNDKLLILIQGSGRESISSRFGWSARGIDLGYDVLFLEKYAYDDSVKFERSESVV